MGPWTGIWHLWASVASLRMGPGGAGHLQRASFILRPSRVAGGGGVQPALTPRPASGGQPALFPLGTGLGLCLSRQQTPFNREWMSMVLAHNKASRSWLNSVRRVVNLAFHPCQSFLITETRSKMEPHGAFCMQPA